MIKGICVAFSMFSRIPMPQFEWKEKEIESMIIFFPLVGVIIGIIVYLWGMVCNTFQINKMCFVLIGTAIPLIISGGIHLDGYMDTMDAFNSYQNKEKKLEILKDAHIGAFAVIQVLLYYMIYLGAYCEIRGAKAIALLGVGFYFSRIISAVSIVNFNGAKKEGLLYTFSDWKNKTKIKIYIYLQLFICSSVLLFISLKIGSTIFVFSILLLEYYRRKCKKELGGITGDTTGYLVTLCEGCVIVIIALGCVFNLI